MKLSELHPDDVSIVSAAPEDSPGPLKLSSLKPGEAQLVQAAPTETESGLRSFASGFTGGFDDELTGALGAAGRVAGVKNLGSWKPLDPNSHLETTSEPLSKEALLQAYRDNRDAIRGQQAQDMATNPKATFAGNIAGAVVSPLSKITAGEAAGNATKIQKLGQAMKTGAIQGAIYGAGGSNSDLTKGEVGQFALDTGLGAGIGVLVPPAVEVAKGVVGGAQSAAKWGGSKLLSLMGGVSPKVIQEYAPYAERINSAPSVEVLKDISDNFVGKLSSDVDAKKITLDQAHDAFKGFQSDIKDAYKTAGYDARDAVTSAEQTLKDAHGARIQQLSGDIYDTVNQLKSDVQEGSKKAIGTLDKSNSKADLAPVYSKIDETISRLKGSGTDEALAVADKLQSYKDRLTSKNGASIFGPDAKRLIQGLDQITEYSPMAGSFDKAKNAAFKDVRSALDQSLKSSVPEYRAAMEPVAADSSLLGRVQDFGDKQTSAGLLGRINAPNQMERRAALKELGDKYGADFVSAAQPENLPEQAILNKAQAAKESLRPDRVAEKIDQTVSNSRQQSELNAAHSAYDAAQDKISPFKSLAPNAQGQTLAQQKLTQLASGKNIELERMFTELGKMTNTDFVQAMKDRNILAAFQKGATNGSRNTLMGSLLGAMVGWGIGGGSGGLIEGGAVGGSMGRIVDQWGPAMTKKFLDASIKVSKSPTVSTITGLDLPDTMKRKLVVSLEDYLAKSHAGNGSQAAIGNVAQGSGQTNREPSELRGESKWANDGVQKLQLDGAQAQQLMGTSRGKQLLIQASDLKPGSPAMDKVYQQIQKELKGAR